MDKFNPNEIPISPENPSRLNNAHLPKNKESQDYQNKNIPEKMTRRKAIKKLFAGTAFIALSTAAEKLGTNKDILRAMIEYAASSPTKEEPPEFEQLKEKIEKEYAPSVEMQTLAYEIQGKARQLLKDNNFLPKKLFSDNFFDAIQIQESQLKSYAQSEKGAIGVMQVRPITVKEVIRYLNILETKGVIKFEGPQMKNLSDKDVADLIFLTRENSDLGEAFGKLYFADLFNNFEIGQEIFSLGGITKARTKLLTAYNWNPDSFKKNEHDESVWPQESKEYCVKIMNNITSLNVIQKEISQLEMQTDPRILSTLLTIELNRYKDVDLTNSIFLEMLHSYLGGIHAKEAVLGRPLKKEEVQEMIDDRNHATYRLFVNNTREK